MVRALIAALAVAAVVLSSVTSADADVTLGTSTYAGGTGGNLLPGQFALGVSLLATFSYTVPAGGGAITSWAISTSHGSPGVRFAFFVARGSRILALDERALPDPQPVSHLATYTPGAPIVVAAGDRIGLLRPLDSTTGTFTSAFGGGGVAPDQTFAFGTFTGGVGGDLATAHTGTGSQMYASAVVRQAVNVRASGGVSPAKPVVGQLMLLSGTIRNAGPSSADLAVTDTVPGGLKIL